MNLLLSLCKNVYIFLIVEKWLNLLWYKLILTESADYIKPLYASVNIDKGILNPWPWREGSVHPSILPSGSFLVIGSLIFYESQHGGRGSCVVCVTEPDFLKKIFLPKNEGNGPKIGKKKGF